MIATPAVAPPAPATPLAAALAAPGRSPDRFPDDSQAALTKTAGLRTFAFFSDADTELLALTTAAAAFDLGARTRVRITGQDRVRWLNGMVTNTVKALAAGSHNYTFVLNAQGRIQGDATVFASPDHLVLETDAAQSAQLLAHFERFIIMDDVELALVAAQTTLGLAGPAAATILTALGLPTPETGTFTSADWHGTPLTIVAEESILAPRFSLWVPEARVEPLWTALLTAGATPSGAHALHALRVLEGTPLYGTDISDKTLAQETGQTRALNFNKGCYLGQEIVERVRSRANAHRGIRQFALHGAPATPGTPLLADAASIGELTSVATIHLPAFTGQLALGTVRTEPLDRGAKLTYGAIVTSGDPTAHGAPPTHPEGTAEWLAHPPALTTNSHGGAS